MLRTASVAGPSSFPPRKRKQPLHRPVRQAAGRRDIHRLRGQGDDLAFDQRLHDPMNGVARVAGGSYVENLRRHAKCRFLSAKMLWIPPNRGCRDEVVRCIFRVSRILTHQRRQVKCRRSIRVSCGRDAVVVLKRVNHDALSSETKAYACDDVTNLSNHCPVFRHCHWRAPVRARPPTSCNTTATSGRSWPRTASPATGRTAPPARPTCGSTSATSRSSTARSCRARPSESAGRRADRFDRRRCGHAAAGDEEEADGGAEGDAASSGSPKGPSISRTGR